MFVFERAKILIKLE